MVTVPGFSYVYRVYHYNCCDNSEYLRPKVESFTRLSTAEEQAAESQGELEVSEAKLGTGR